MGEHARARANIEHRYLTVQNHLEYIWIRMINIIVLTYCDSDTEQSAKALWLYDWLSPFETTLISWKKPAYSPGVPFVAPTKKIKATSEGSVQPASE